MQNSNALKENVDSNIDDNHVQAKCLVKCQDCGERQKIVWTSDLKCPVCNSKKFFPVVKVDSLEEDPEPTAEIIIEKEKKTQIRIKKEDVRKAASIFFVILLAVIWGYIGVMLINMYFNRKTAPENLLWEYRCTTCNNRFLDIPLIAPIRCQVCNSKTAYVTFICNDTGKRFTMIDKTKVPRSPYTNSTNIEVFRPKSGY